MGTEPQLRTQRLLLRRWRAEDLEHFAAMNADLRVMEFFPAALSREQSAAMIERIDSGQVRAPQFSFSSSAASSDC